LTGDGARASRRRFTGIAGSGAGYLASALFSDLDRFGWRENFGLFAICSIVLCLPTLAWARRIERRAAFAHSTSRNTPPPRGSA
jgi:hypothetical protein